jgi:hypothetical protein
MRTSYSRDQNANLLQSRPEYDPPAVEARIRTSYSRGQNMIHLQSRRPEYEPPTVEARMRTSYSRGQNIIHLQSAWKTEVFHPSFLRDLKHGRQKFYNRHINYRNCLRLFKSILDLFSTASRSALGPSQPLIQLVPVAYFPGGKRARGKMVITRLHLASRIRMCGTIHTAIPIQALHGLRRVLLLLPSW